METALIVILAICLIGIIIWREFKLRGEKSFLERERDKLKYEKEGLTSELEKRFTKEDVERKVKEALNQSRAKIKGDVGEQMALLFPEFKWEAKDCRFIGDPIDFIVFQGLTEGDPQKIIFVEVKTGTSGVKKGNERNIKNLVESIKSQSDKVDWKLVQLRMETKQEKV